MTFDSEDLLKTNKRYSSGFKRYSSSYAETKGYDLHTKNKNPKVIKKASEHKLGERKKIQCTTVTREKNLECNHQGLFRRNYAGTNSMILGLAENYFSYHTALNY
jgi:hypothetical protein